jgi:hypothetical protein
MTVAQLRNMLANYAAEVDEDAIVRLDAHGLTIESFQFLVSADECAYLGFTPCLDDESKLTLPIEEINATQEA